jgi:SAM-dependent methyltransferase
VHGQVVAAAAEAYEAWFVPALFGQWAGRVVPAAGVRTGGRVLDVGCGTGVLARAAADVVGPSGRVEGLDANPGMLAVARRVAPGITWREGAAGRLPHPDASFDAVTCGFVLMFVDDPAAVAREAARVLVAGGRAVFTTWASADRSPGYAAMIDLLGRVVGPAVADALRVPFRLGTADLLQASVAGSGAFADVVLEEWPGEARFPSIDDWVATDIRAWALADAVDDATYAELLAAARTDLRAFTDPDGAVRFPTPAIAAVARA